MSSPTLHGLGIDDEQEIFNISECFGYDDDDLPPSSFPLRHEDIAKAQLDNPASLLKLGTNKDFSEATFRGGDKEHELTCHNGKMALPPSLQQKTTCWHHEMLCHPGITRTEATIRQHFDWKGLRTMVIATCKKCQLCQVCRPHRSLQDRTQRQKRSEAVVSNCDRPGNRLVQNGANLQQDCRRGSRHLRDGLVHKMSTPTTNHPRPRH
jgi:hypothetical protein